MFVVSLVIFTMYEKHMAREAHLESPQRYMMEVFRERVSLELFSQKKTLSY